MQKLTFMNYTENVKENNLINGLFLYKYAEI